MRTNLTHLLDPAALKQIDDDIASAAVSMFGFGEQHFLFADSLAKTYWRQTVSRCYYAAYNIVRSIRLYIDGSYSTDSSDHKKIDQLPNDFPSRSTYTVQLPILREDRNLCDYDYSASDTDLALGRDDSLRLVRNLIADARAYANSKGLLIP